VAELRPPDVGGRGGWIFQEPVAGWRGTLTPSARVVNGEVSSISADGDQIAVQQVGSYQSETFEQDWVLSRPQGGWNGTLTGEAPAETPLGGSSPEDTAGLSAGQLDGNDLIVATADADLPPSIAIERFDNAPVAATVIPGPAQLGLVRLSGLAFGHPELMLGVKAGQDEAALKTIILTLPAGLWFVRSIRTLRSNVLPCDQGISCTLIAANQLKLVINPNGDDVSSQSIEVPSKVLHESATLKRALETRAQTLRIRVRILDAVGVTAARTATIKVR
jgi:hypothetical protein